MHDQDLDQIQSNFNFNAIEDVNINNQNVTIKNEPGEYAIDFVPEVSDEQLDQKLTVKIEPEELCATTRYIVPDLVDETLSLELGNTIVKKDEGEEDLSIFTEDEKSTETDCDTKEGISDTVIEESQPRNKRKQVLKPLMDPGETDRTCQLVQSVDSHTKKKSRRHAVKNKIHLCQECGMQFTLLKYLKIHKKIHRKQKKLKCAICLTNFNTLDDIGDHSLLHKFNCVMCKKSLASFGNFTYHLQKAHPEIKPYKCSVCEIRFSSHTKFKHHEQDYHITSNKHLCSACKKDFKSVDDLQSHICLHTRPYSCCYCSASFTSFKSLSLHTRNSHSDSKEHECPECGKKFGMAHLLIRHLYSSKAKSSNGLRRDFSPACAVVKQ